MFGSLIFYAIFLVGLATLIVIVYAAGYIYINPQANALFKLLLLNSRSAATVSPPITTTAAANIPGPPSSRRMFSLDDGATAAAASNIVIPQMRRPERIVYTGGIIFKALTESGYSVVRILDLNECSVFSLTSTISPEETLILFDNAGNMYRFVSGDNVPRLSLNAAQHRVSEKQADEITKLVTLRFASKQRFVDSPANDT